MTMEVTKEEKRMVESKVPVEVVSTVEESLRDGKTYVEVPSEWVGQKVLIRNHGVPNGSCVISTDGKWVELPSTKVPDVSSVKLSDRRMKSNRSDMSDVYLKVFGKPLIQYLREYIPMSGVSTYEAASRHVKQTLEENGYRNRWTDSVARSVNVSIY